MPHKSRNTGPGHSRKHRSNPLKIAQMLAELVEMSPAVVYPLQLKAGARTVLHTQNQHAILDVTNTEDGTTYQITVSVSGARTAPASGSDLL